MASRNPKRLTRVTAYFALLAGCASAPSEPSNATMTEFAQSTPGVQWRPPLSTSGTRDDFSRALSDRLSRSSAGLSPQRTSTGSMRLDFRGRRQHVSVATQGADGRLRHRCISSPGELDALLGKGYSGSESPRNGRQP
jgi:hypothetical protein